MIEITPSLLLTDISSTEICQESFSTFIVLLSGLDLFYFFKLPTIMYLFFIASKYIILACCFYEPSSLA